MTVECSAPATLANFRNRLMGSCNEEPQEKLNPMIDFDTGLGLVLPLEKSCLSSPVLPQRSRKVAKRGLSHPEPVVSGL